MDKNKSKDIHVQYRDKSPNFSERILSLFRFNITFKLTVEFTITFIAFLILLNMLFYVGIKGWFYIDTIKTMKQIEKKLEADIAGAESLNIDDDIFDIERIDYFIFDEDSKILMTSNMPDMSYQENMGRINLDVFIQRNQPQWFYYETAFNIGDNKIILLLRKNAEDIHREINRLWSIIIIASIIMIFLVALSLLRISKKHLKPIRIMTNKVQHISVNDLSERLDVRGTKDELKDLAATFNKMMDEIENSYEKQKQFVSDASHELRTPIAVIKGYASMVNRWGKEDPSVLEESLKAIEEESRNMQSLVESLLFLARRDKGSMEMEKELFNAKTFMEEIIKESNLIDSQQHKFSSTLEYDGEIYASADKLKQAIRIFIDNSMKYTPSGGEIEIVLKSSNKDIYIIIKDNGIGISKEDLPYIFERFYRADQARTRTNKGGTGLGLAIAKVIIEQHDGRIFVQSEPDEGTSVTIMLPKNNENQ